MPAPDGAHGSGGSARHTGGTQPARGVPRGQGRCAGDGSDSLAPAGGGGSTATGALPVLVPVLASVLVLAPVLVLLLVLAVVLGSADQSGALAQLLPDSARSQTPTCDTPYLTGSEMQCSGHPDGFVTLPWDSALINQLKDYIVVMWRVFFVY